MTEKLLAYMRQLHMVEAKDHVCLALSGGADSVALLLALKELEQDLQITLLAVHVEHGIRGQESLRDMTFCQQLCTRLGIPLQVCQVDAPKAAQESGRSLEEAARELRYGCLKQAIAPYGEAGKIAVAHHQDDQCETMLFHLARGSSIDGLAGIRPVRGQIIRPMLCLTRAEIESFLAERGQDYCKDSTNEDTAYSRNLIRHDIMPAMKQVNDRAEEHMSRFAMEMTEVSAYLDKQVSAAIDGLVEELPKGELQIHLSGLAKEDPYIAKRMLMELLGRLAGSRKDLTTQHVQAVLDLSRGQSGRQVSLPYQLIARREFDKLILGRKSQSAEERLISSEHEAVASPEHETAASPEDETAQVELIKLIPGEYFFQGIEFQVKVFDFDGDLGKIPLKMYTKWLDYDKIQGGLCLRHRKSGDFLQVTEAGGSKKLKSYLIEEKIPLSDRDSLVLVADGSHILWVVGHRISEGYKVTENTKKVLEIKCYEGNHS